MFSLMPYAGRRNDVFSLFRDFEKDFFGDFNKNVFASFNTDIRDEGDRYELEAELPGFDKNDIDIRIDGDYLTISAQRSNSQDTTDKKGNYIRKERSFSSYRRSFNISDVSTSEITAEYTDGLLKLSIPKVEPETPEVKRIEIK